MKTNGWKILGAVLLASTLIARADGQLEPEKPKTEKKADSGKAAPARKAPPEKPIVLVPGPATISGNNVNVRGKAGYKGEVFTKLNSGDTVTVIEQVILQKPKAGEPAQWAKIAIPANAHVWVHSTYIDANKTVKPKKLNVRTGPGENYSVVGTIEQGTAVKEVSTKDNWLQIEAPASAFAYVAASYVQQKPTDTAVSPVVSVVPPETSTNLPPSNDNIASTITDNPGVIATNNPDGEPTPTVIPDAANATPPPPVLIEEDIPRFVSHEGVVRGSGSIQAPSEFALYSKETGKAINYLYSPTPQLDVGKYFGRRIIVNGEESLDKRWTNTPVLTIQKIYVVE
ncbi:MAG TPA: SH3 domain-containing protein [Verrucomicrobiae bacterium]|nr:SH3 domain-containing protein [Verrucomicrobiae bacterium]